MIFPVSFFIGPFARHLIAETSTIFWIRAYQNTEMRVSVYIKCIWITWIALFWNLTYNKLYGIHRKYNTKFNRSYQCCFKSQLLYNQCWGIAMDSSSVSLRTSRSIFDMAVNTLQIKKHRHMFFTPILYKLLKKQYQHQ